ncbi:hypothetical protein HDE_10051 [Halotydeus destructor]|nr:hypothetical protein HDE_10051 [Halotydeus destructor]
MSDGYYHFRVRIGGPLNLWFTSSKSSWKHVISASELQAHKNGAKLKSVNLPFKDHEILHVTAENLGPHVLDFEKLVLIPLKTRHTLKGGLSPSRCARFERLLSYVFYVELFEYCEN